MKVLFVLHQFPPEGDGGTERSVRAIAIAMRDLGHDVVIVSGSLQVMATAPAEEGAFAGLRVIRLHRDDLYFESWWKTWSPTVSAAFAAVLAREQPDVVHVQHWLRLSSDLVRQARGHGAIAAATVHDVFPVLARCVRRADETGCAAPPLEPCLGEAERAEAFAFHRRDFAEDLRAAQLRYAPSRAHAELVAGLAPAELGAFAVARPPLLAVPARTSSLAPGQRRRRLVTWGALYPDKGVHTLLEALARVPGWELTVFGEAADPQYRRHLEALAVGQTVRFAGRFTATDLAQHAADYAVLPSLALESYGLTLDEAMHLGWPMLAADLPAYRERAPAAATAFFRPGDVAQLAALLAAPEALHALHAPAAPAAWTAADAARQLLADYERARHGETMALPPLAPVADAERAALLWRRSERRFWSALQQREPPAPPF